MLKLPSDNAFGLETQPIAIEAERFLQVIHSEGDKRDPWGHDVAPVAA
jgi:hypothetical protein